MARPVMVWLLAVTWLFACVAKAATLDQLNGMVKAILPGAGDGAPWIARGVVAVEGLTGTILLIPRLRSVGLLMSLVGAFALLGVNYLRLSNSIHAPCACFGGIYVTVPVPMALADVLLIVASVHGLLAVRYARTL